MSKNTPEVGTIYVYRPVKGIGHFYLKEGDQLMFIGIPCSLGFTAIRLDDGSVVYLRYFETLEEQVDIPTGIDLRIFKETLALVKKQLEEKLETINTALDLLSE